ncbi:hypothetical protein GUJ93_ZPchr0007g5700 [Zizania palustris]|uniref:Uncharacterized protein n=1 Tax=Zizania palustris TaxID=103762 RepID=A0A8J5T1I2_ZIZPA|nr:hypothetical protein GUJ93_ZPchr0007g5700 [Zizania palustris]
MENKGKSKSNDSEKIVCQADWENPEMTTIFCNIVVEEIQAGNRPLGLGRHPVLGIPTASDEWWETNTKGHLKREKRTFRYAPPPCLKQWEIMFEKSHVSGQSACIPGEEVCGDAEEEGDNDPIHELDVDQFTPTSSARTQLKRKGKSGSPRKISPRKKGKNSMVRVMSRMVDDVISSNSVTSKELNDDFTHEFCK